MLKTIGKQLVIGFVILSGFAHICNAEEAPSPAAPASKWYDAVSVNGFVDAYYSYNANGWQGQGDNKLHNFDFNSNDLAVSMVELNIVKPAEKDKAGFYIGLAFGPAANWIGSASCGSTQNDNSSCADSAYKNLRQAFVSIMPLSNLQVDFGKFVTQHGAEVIESKDDWNYTRSLLFSYAIPYYHSGVRATYTVNDQLYVMGNITNGWNNVAETNAGKTYGIQLGVTPVKALPIVINYMTGPEVVSGAAGTTAAVSDTRSLLDVLVTCNATDTLSFMANYDNGVQKQGKGPGQDALWSGYALYARKAFTPAMAAVIRYEELNDRDGFTTGVAQKVSEETLTLEYAAPGWGLIRLDFRHDQTDAPSSAAVFTKADKTSTSSQDTVTLGVVFTF